MNDQPFAPGGNDPRNDLPATTPYDNDQMRVATEAGHVEDELRQLELGHGALNATLATLGSVAEEATEQGQIIQRESKGFLDRLHAA